MSSSRPEAPVGAQTLARGIRALQSIASRRSGLSIQEVAEELGVHRSVASRLLQTLEDAALVTRGGDGRFRGGVGLIPLADSGIVAFRDRAQPVVRELVGSLGDTTALFVEAGEQAHALIVEIPRSTGFHLALSQGAIFPLTAGAAGLALRSLHPARPDDPAALAKARSDGFARSSGEVEPGVEALAVPIPQGLNVPRACLMTVSARPESLSDAVEPLTVAARTLAG